MKRTIIITTLLLFAMGITFPIAANAGQSSGKTTTSITAKAIEWDDMAKASKPKALVFSIADLILNWLGIGQNGPQCDNQPPWTRNDAQIWDDNRHAE